PNAIGYTVEVSTTRDRLVARSAGKLSDTTWMPDRPLSRGETYKWRLTALLPDGRTILPSSPARFRILPLKELRRLAPLMQDHLRKGDIYRRAFLLDDAEREYHAVPPDFPVYGLQSQQRLKDLETALSKR